MLSKRDTKKRAIASSEVHTEQPTPQCAPSDEKSSSTSTQLIRTRLKDETSASTDDFKDNNLYEILEVERTATVAEISKAYHRLALIHHPDKGGTTGKFNTIKHAYFVLRDKERRAEYDAVLDDQTAEKKYKEASFKIFKEENETTFYTRYDDLSQMPPALADMFLDANRFFSKDDKPLMRPLKKGDILYVTGKPIRFGEGSQVFRPAIPEEEIINSFPREGKVRVFRNEYTAQQYCRYNRTENFYTDPHCAQPALLKIQISKTHDAELKSHRLDLHEEYLGCKSKGFNCFDHLEVDMKYIAPISTHFKVETFIGSKEYPSVTFRKANNEKRALQSEPENTVDKPAPKKR